MAKVSASTFSDLGGAVSDIFGGLGGFSQAKGYKSIGDAYRASSDLYGEQAGVYGQMGDQSAVNAAIAAGGQSLKTAQTEREIYKTIGGQQADYGAAGLAQSGSALDVIRDSTSQGVLQMGVLRSQGLLEQSGYKQEQLSYQAMGKASEAAAAAATGQAGMADAQAAASKKSGIGGILGGVLKIASVAAPFVLSDLRAKRNIVFMDRREDGIGHYLFSYLDSDALYIGVMAQEVAKIYPDAVTVDQRTGYFMVNYAMINDAMYHVGIA